MAANPRKLPQSYVKMPPIMRYDLFSCVSNGHGDIAWASCRNESEGVLGGLVVEYSTLEQEVLGLIPASTMDWIVSLSKTLKLG